MSTGKHMVKYDLNFLHHPLWFQVSRTSEEMTWSNEEGYCFQAEYRAPDQLDQLFLLYLLLRSQEQGYAARMDFSRYEILKGCHCPINPQYLKRLEDSLKRWQSVRVSFQDNFLQDKTWVSAQFCILDSFRLRESDRRLEIHLNPEFLNCIQNSVHFKYLDFHYYRMLRRPVSRRLYELLTFHFKQGHHWKLPLVELGKKLTLYSRQRKNRHGEIEEVLYPSDVLTAVKAAVEEINTLSTDTEKLRELGMDPREIYAVTYEVNKKKKSIDFHRAPLTHLFDELIQERTPRQVHSKQEAKLEELIRFLKRNSRPLRELVTQYYHSHGYDFVKWNLFYANRNGARNYVSYLRLCLQHNWAQEFREEYERMFEASQQKLDDRKLTYLIKVAERADHLRLPDGKKFRIKRVFPNGAIEISNRAYKMDFVLSPAQAYNCRFERVNPQP